MKVAAGNQSVILASQYRGPTAKTGSVFDAALGPAATRNLPKPLTIVAAAGNSIVHDADGGSLDDATAGEQQPLESLQPIEPVSHAVIGTAQPASRRATIAGTQGRRPLELYTQTQQILSPKSARSVFLDVHA